MKGVTFTCIADSKNPGFLKVIKIYLESFPANERQPVELMSKRVDDGLSKLFVGILNEEIVCMGFLWQFKNSEFVLLDYLAVKTKYRNNRIGSDFFCYLSNTVKIEKKYLLMEVETHSFRNNQDQRKQRINFYLRNGAFIIQDVPYILPSLDASTSTEMILMISPKYHKSYIDKNEFELILKRLYYELYSKDSNDDILISILNRIPDRVTFNNRKIK